MKKLSSEQIRNMWISFYEKKKHVLIPSVSLIPFEDPSLLWINSGVAGLKKYFDGSEVPPSKRLVNVQKAIRTSDIENVGYTPRHHTFFEMLGNFSIGDYFRDEMLMYAIELLTSEEYYGLPLNKLYFTYLPSDTKTYQTWMKYGVESDHLIPLESNYWEIGEGPSGPNTEVFYDRGEKYDPEGKGISLLKEDLENDRYVELWGIVFSQFNAVSGVKREDYEELPSKNIDTGLGLERLACVLQDKETNFETDLFLPIIEKLSSLTKKPYIESNYIAFRVIVDHVRSVVFALSDGEMFSNEGRGYVSRRLLRRAMRFGRTLGMEQPFLYELVDVVENVMGSFYKELSSSLALVKRSIKSEEEKFIKTLRSGESILR
ncbi:MAG: alanine--tRNA ligase-related protein, partial [Bacilli bacterium]|nr:alanine--tRNA ligase-related protein [Bacilli bacterium]